MLNTIFEKFDIISWYVGDYIKNLFTSYSSSGLVLFVILALFITFVFARKTRLEGGKIFIISFVVIFSVLSVIHYQLLPVWDGFVSWWDKPLWDKIASK